MNTEDLNFAYQVRHALNDMTEQLPGATTERLAAARKQALARRKRSPLLAWLPRSVLAHPGGGQQEIISAWLGRTALLLPLLVVAIGLSMLYDQEQERRLVDTAEIDAAVLSDELPLEAYLDHGFNGYLAKRAE